MPNEKRPWSDVVDDACECGHLKSEHVGARCAMAVHGVRGIKLCPCSQFRRKKFVYAAKTQKGTTAHVQE
jgi:hypothetical protein